MIKRSTTRERLDIIDQKLAEVITTLEVVQNDISWLKCSFKEINERFWVIVVLIISVLASTLSLFLYK